MLCRSKPTPTRRLPRFHRSASILLKIALLGVLTTCDDPVDPPAPSGTTDAVLIMEGLSGYDPPIGAALLVLDGDIRGVTSSSAQVLTYQQAGRTYVALVLEEPSLQVPFQISHADDLTPSPVIVEVASFQDWLLTDFPDHYALRVEVTDG